MKKLFFKYIKLLPSIRRKIEAEMEKVNSRFEHDMASRTAHLAYITDLPETPFTPNEILKIVDETLSTGCFIIF